MKNYSINFILLFVAITATMISCKKLDGPVPSTRALLTAKTWTATSFVNSGITIPVIPGDCNGIVVQFTNAGAYYEGDGCSTPTISDSWTISDKLITFGDATIIQITSIDSKNMTITDPESGTVVYFTAN